MDTSTDPARRDHFVMRRARAPRAREPWGKRPNGPAARYVRLFVAAVVVVALFGRLKASRDVASSASDAVALTSATARREELVFDASTLDPPAFARDPTHVHLPRGGYLVAWVGGVDARAGRGVEVWASQRAPMSRDGWSTPRVVARSPGAPASHSAPTLFYVGDLLHLRFLADGAPHVATSADHGHSWTPAAPSSERAVGACASNVIVTRRVGGARAVLCGVVGDDGDARVDVSLDDGVTFARGATLVSSRTDAPLAPVALALWRRSETTRGGVHVVSALTVASDGRVSRSDSTDGGSTWTAATELGVSSRGGAPSAASCGRRGAVLSTTPTDRGATRVLFSEDGGKTWTDAGFELARGGSGGACVGATLTPWPEGGEGFAATCVRDESEIVFVVGDAAAVRARDGVGGTDATR